MFWLAEVFNGSRSHEEMQRIEQYARRQRAETVARLFSAIGHGLARLGTALVAAYRGLARWQRRRAAIRELSGLSDHILKDIGIGRGDIRPAVDALLDGKPDVVPGYRASSADQRRPATAVTSGTSADQQDSDSNWQRAA